MLSLWTRRELLRAGGLSFGETAGIVQNEWQVKQTQELAAAALAALREEQHCRNQLRYLCRRNETVQRMAEGLGEPTACMLYALVGDPTRFHCGAAYRKSIGLNLKERSSGKYKGQLKITKRGNSQARRWLYLAALRAVQKPGVAEWYAAKKKRDKDKALPGIVGVMRKLVLSVHHVCRTGERWDWQRVFPGCPLDHRSAPPDDLPPPLGLSKRDSPEVVVKTGE